MFDTFTSPATPIWDGVRIVFSFLDRGAYGLLGLIYELFFNVASADLFSNEMIMKFYTRVQIVLGVYMMFVLAMTFLRGIVNPDNFEKDSTSFVTKAITALLIFGLLVPIGTGGGNEFEKQVNNNGLLFGTLYSLQHRILANNTLGRLILGTNDTETQFSNTPTEGDDSELKQSARIFTSTILKGFYRINLVPDDQRVNKGDGKDPAVYNENRVCTDIDDGILDAYKKVDADPGEILDLVTATCDSEAKPSFLNDIATGFQKLTGTTKYIFTFTPLISTITAIIFIFILLSFTVDVAVRAVKLAVLRLIAPIPIISYMNPQAGKDGPFNAWVKTLISTYLDLFIRLASVYFVIFLIQDMIVEGVSISTTAGSGFLHVASMIIIWIALFIFAKQAPKFIKQVLGLKDDIGKLFGGFGEIAAIGAAGAGVVGSATTNYRAAKEENKELHPDSPFNGVRNVGSAIAGAIAGGYVGGKALLNKDASAKSVMAAQNQRNAMRAAHSTFPGRVQSTLYGLATGRGLSEQGNLELKLNNEAFKAFKDYKTTLEDEALKKTDLYGEAVKGSGQVFNYQKLSAAVERARSSGQSTFEYNDGKHHYVNLRTDDFDVNTMNEVKSSQAQAYSEKLMTAVQTNDTTYLGSNGTAHNSYLTAAKAAKDAQIPVFDGKYGNTKAGMGQAKTAATQSETSMKTMMRRANDQAKGK